MTLSPRLKPEGYFAPVSNNKTWFLFSGDLNTNVDFSDLIFV
jgi:hypothetical protein